MTPRVDFVFDYFGGKNMQRDFYTASNIIFTNGVLDPWSVGSIMANTGFPTEWKCTTIYMKDAAHHLELRPENTADPTDVKNART